MPLRFQQSYRMVTAGILYLDPKALVIKFSGKKKKVVGGGKTVKRRLEIRRFPAFQKPVRVSSIIRLLP